jgi:hypothetical protein
MATGPKSLKAGTKNAPPLKSKKKCGQKNLIIFS